ncbi:hypothetical protein BDW59DRAFT_139342 [Aspergillus cavernicola]|uniref:Uncharacterized protein n=1 Tax=Aspergillus cavernicola TaxID=176166 RepID=A0ABR4J0C4_9EURO
MDDTSSSSSRSTSPRPTLSSSRHTTPDQIFEYPSSPQGVSGISPPHPLDASNIEVPLQQVATLIQAEGGPLGIFLTWLYDSRRNSDQAIAAEREKLVEYQKSEAIVQQSLRDARDLAQTRLDEERARADRNERERDATRAETAQLARTVHTIESQLADVIAETNEIQGQLDEGARQLADAERQCSKKEELLYATLHLLARTENEKNAISERLDAELRQRETAERDLAERRQSSDRQLTDLSTLRDRLNEEQSQRTTAEDQLHGQTDELARLRNELDEEKNRHSELELELDLVRGEAVEMDTLRSETNRLLENNQILANEAIELRRERHVLKRQIHGLQEQHGATANEIESVNEALRKERTTTTGLRSTISNLERYWNERNNEVQQLRAECEANAALRRERSAIGRENDTLQARCTVLDAKVAELKAAIDQVNNVRAKLPRHLGVIKYRGSRRKLAVVQSGPVIIHEAYSMSRVQPRGWIG